MCLAIPGKVVLIQDGKALVDYSGEKHEAIAKGIDIHIGDYVLVQFGMVVEKLNKEEALKAMENMKSLLNP